MTTPIPIDLDGSSSSAGQFSPALYLITHLPDTAGHSVGNGALSITQSNVPGAFADFAVVPYGPTAYSDPVFSTVTSSTIRLGGTGDVANEWRRLSVTATTPNAPYAPGPVGALYSTFEYARPGLTASSMTLNETHQIAYIQLEKTPPGSDIDTDQFGSNLFTLEQASYEGRILYEPVGGGGETNYMMFSRTTERASCGEFSGRLLYQTPPQTNSYAAVAQFGSYSNLASKRQTYADVKYRTFLPGEGPPENPQGSGAPSGTPVAAPPVLTLRPLQAALVRVEPGVTYQAQISAAAEAAGQQFQCAILRFDSGFNLIGTYAAGEAVTTAGGYTWQQASAQLLMEDNAVWAAVVPRLTTGGASRVQAFVDEHRIWVPSTLATKKGGASPARPWQPPRQLIIKLRATRINYAKNPNFQKGLWGWDHVRDPSVTAALTLVTSGGIVGNAASYRIATVPTATLINGTSPRTGVTSTTGSQALVDRLTPGTIYTASVYVKPVSSPIPITMWAHNGAQLIRGTSTPVADPTGDGWDRISVTFKTSDTFGGTGAISIGYAADEVAALCSANPPGVSETIWTPLADDPDDYPPWSQTSTYTAGQQVSYEDTVWQAAVDNGPYPNLGPLEFRYSQLLVEQADKVAPYFDGNEPSGDYMWEGTPGDSRSHYYRGKRVNQYRLDQIIQRQIGVGGAYRIVYASAP